MSLESFNMQTLIHVGVELVVVGGLAFWANRRIVGVENSVADLAKRIIALEGVIEKQQQFMLQQDALLRQMLGMVEPQAESRVSNRQPQPEQRRQSPPVSQPLQYQTSPHIPSPQQSFESRPNIPQPNPNPNPRQPSESRQEPVQEDPDIPSHVLDDIINKELGISTEMEIHMTEPIKTPIKKKKTKIVAAHKKKSKKDIVNAEL